MSFLHRVAEIVDQCKSEYEEIARQSASTSECNLDRMAGVADFNLDEMYDRYIAKEAYQEVLDDGWLEKENLLGYGDNLQFMRFLLEYKEMKGKIDLIYVDPPFYSKADYSIKLNIQSDKLEEDVKVKQIAYTDHWEGGLEDYLRMICLRLYMMKELLSDTGSIWVHLDWHVSHYVKLIMDEIFGAENFINEVIWNYKSGGTSSRRFARKHDTLLFYGKTKDYYFEAQKEKSYNRGFKPYHFKGVEEFQDEVGWYTMVNMKDVWQLDMVGRTSAERTGYATQKPEALLERILRSCTKEGDVCADFFGGSGTLAAVASKMGRRWITCDMGSNSLAAIKRRLIGQNARFVVYKDKGIKETFEHIKECATTRIKERRNLKLEFGCGVHDSKKRVQIRLIGYIPNENAMKSLKESERKEIKDALAKDPLCLIQSWSVDFEYNGDIHRPAETHFRKKGILKDTVEKELREITDMSVSIRFIDVWGNEAKEIVEL